MATLSRRTLLAAGGTGLLALMSAGLWRRRARAARLSPGTLKGSVAGYADHRGWMVTADEKQKLSPAPAPPIP
jgi:hypothetical protein